MRRLRAHLARLPARAIRVGQSASSPIPINLVWQSLPRPPFTDQETEALVSRVYDYVWQRSASGDGLLAA